MALGVNMDFEQILIIAKNGFQIPIENLKKEKQVEIFRQLNQMRNSCIGNEKIEVLANTSYSLQEYLGGLLDTETKYLLLFDISTLDFAYDILKEAGILQDFISAFSKDTLEFSKKFSVKITKDKFKNS